jgi:hypothetical protein
MGRPSRDASPGSAASRSRLIGLFSLSPSFIFKTDIYREHAQAGRTGQKYLPTKAYRPELVSRHIDGDSSATEAGKTRSGGVVRSSRLGLAWEKGAWLACCPQVERLVPTFVLAG